MARSTGVEGFGEAQREFLSLYDSIRSLLTHKDSDSMFRAVVKHAYLLMSTDVIYVSLLDSNALTMHVAHGILDPEFKINRLGTTVGIGGRVLTTRAPIWTTNYQDDPRFEHTEETDAILHREGIVALLGVPLMAGDDIFGALFAGHRSQREFAHDEVAIFSTFADLAAEALMQAEERRAMHSRLEVMRHDYAEAAARVEEAQEANQLHQAILDSLLATGSSEDILATLSEYLNGTVIADGGSFGELGCWPGDDADIEEAASEDVAELLSVAKETGHAESLQLVATTKAIAEDREHEHRWLSVSPIRIGSNETGYLRVITGAALSESQRRSVEYAASALGLFLLQRHAATDAWLKTQTNLLSAILSSTTSVDAEVFAHAATQRIQLESFTTLAIARSNSHAKPFRLIPQEFQRKRLLIGEYSGHIFALGNADDHMEFGQFVHKELTKYSAAAVDVVVSPFDVTHPVKGLVARLVQAIALLSIMRFEEHVISLATLAPYSMMMDPQREHDLDSFCRSLLGPLISHDERHGTDLVTTVSAYFEQGQQQNRTAEALFVHINTLSRRMAKIDGLLGKNWRVGSQAAALHLATQFVTWGVFRSAD